MEKYTKDQLVARFKEQSYSQVVSMLPQESLEQLPEILQEESQQPLDVGADFEVILEGINKFKRNAFRGRRVARRGYRNGFRGFGRGRRGDRYYGKGDLRGEVPEEEKTQEKEIIEENKIFNGMEDLSNHSDELIDPDTLDKSDVHTKLKQI